MTKIEKLRNEALKYYNNGQINTSIKQMQKMFNNAHYLKKTSDKLKASDYNSMSISYRYLGEYSNAIQYAKKMYNLSKEYNAIINLGISYFYNKEYENAISIANEALEIKDDDYTIYDILVESYTALNKFEEATKVGRSSIILKEKSVENYPNNLANSIEIKPFDEKDSNKNIISFSLFGNNPKYCENAIENVLIAKELYPLWKCKFYCSNDVPQNVIQRLESNGAIVVVKEKTKDIKEMLFWRFLPISDKSINVVIVRDCDSLLTSRESIIVNKWIQSNKSFHIIRDYYSHTDLILAGMFGCVTGLFDDIENMYKEFLKKPFTSRTHLDQLFLKQNIWPSIKNNVLIHDSRFHCRENNSEEFFKDDIYDMNNHIGQNVADAAFEVEVQDGLNFSNVKWQITDINNNVICEYITKLINGKYRVNIPRSYTNKIRQKEYKIVSIPFK